MFGIWQPTSKTPALIAVFVALVFAMILGLGLRNRSGGIEYVTLHHLYVLNGDGTRIVANPTIVWGDDGFACQGDDELLRTEFVRDKETDLLMLACFWSQRY